MNFKQMIQSLEAKIKQSYEAGVTMEDAEKLAGEFLGAQLLVSSELKKADLDSRMRKSGVKAVRAAIYMETVSKQDKKPTEAMIEHTINVNELVQSEQQELDKSEVDKDELTRVYNVFRECHVYFRGIAKGRFD